jgi:hypothetical protein
MQPLIGVGHGSDAAAGNGRENEWHGEQETMFRHVHMLLEIPDRWILRPERSTSLVAHQPPTAQIVTGSPPMFENPFNSAHAVEDDSDIGFHGKEMN